MCSTRKYARDIIIEYFDRRFYMGDITCYTYILLCIILWCEYAMCGTFFFLLLVSLSTNNFQLNSWEVLPSAIVRTSSGHRCRLFPPVRAFIFIAHRVQHSHCSSIFIEWLLLTHVLTISPSNSCARKTRSELNSRN